MKPKPFAELESEPVNAVGSNGSIVLPQFKTNQSHPNTADQTLIAMSKRRKFSHSVPGLLYQAERSSKIILYHHANGEDIFDAACLCETVYKYIGISILCVEYPGYGLYTSKKPNEEQIHKDALGVYHHLQDNLRYKPEDIILMGRSIGTGVSIH